MGLGQVEDLLHRLPGPDAEQAARAERDLALHRLEARAARRAPTGRGTRVSRARAVGLEQREEDDEARDAAPPSVARWRSGMPAATSSATIVKAMTSAVPRSGWVATSSTPRPRRAAAA